MMETTEQQKQRLGERWTPKAARLVDIKLIFRIAEYYRKQYLVDRYHRVIRQYDLQGRKRKREDLSEDREDRKEDHEDEGEDAEHAVRMSNARVDKAVADTKLEILFKVKDMLSGSNPAVSAWLGAHMLTGSDTMHLLPAIMATVHSASQVLSLEAPAQFTPGYFTELSEKLPEKITKLKQSKRKAVLKIAKSLQPAAEPSASQRVFMGNTDNIDEITDTKAAIKWTVDKAAALKAELQTKKEEVDALEESLNDINTKHMKKTRELGEKEDALYQMTRQTAILRLKKLFNTVRLQVARSRAHRKEQHKEQRLANVRGRVTQLDNALTAAQTLGVQLTAAVGAANANVTTLTTTLAQARAHEAQLQQQVLQLDHQNFPAQLLTEVQQKYPDFAQDVIMLRNNITTFHTWATGMRQLFAPGVSPVMRVDVLIRLCGEVTGDRAGAIAIIHTLHNGIDGVLAMMPPRHSHFLSASKIMELDNMRLGVNDVISEMRQLLYHWAHIHSPGETAAAALDRTRYYRAAVLRFGAPAAEAGMEASYCNNHVKAGSRVLIGFKILFNINSTRRSLPMYMTCSQVYRMCTKLRASYHDEMNLLPTDIGQALAVVVPDANPMNDARQLLCPNLNRMMYVLENMRGFIQNVLPVAGFAMQQGLLLRR